MCVNKLGDKNELIKSGNEPKIVNDVVTRGLFVSCDVYTELYDKYKTLKEDYNHLKDVLKDVKRLVNGV